MDKESFKHYKLDIAELDRDHWDIISSLTKYCDHRGDVSLDTITSKFYEHCIREEQFMKSIDYPFLQVHIEEHYKLQRALQDCIDRVRDNVFDRFSISSFIHTFASHIDHQDLQIVDFINKNRM